MHQSINAADRGTSLLVVALTAGFLSASPMVTADEHQPAEAAMGWWIPSGTPAKNFYGSVGFSFDHSDYPDAVQDGSVSSVSDDESDLGYGFSLGYQINDTVAVEGRYRQFGEPEFSGSADGSGVSWTAAGPVSAKQDVDAWELGVMGRWPVAPRWYALGFLGWSWWESEETFVESGFVSVEKDSGSDVTYALGFEYDAGLKDRILYRFMGEHHQVDEAGDNVNSAKAEIVYRFP